MSQADQIKGAVPFSRPAAIRYYIPLVLQAISQSLTYPLVATITSRGEGGVTNLAAFAQGQTVVFVLGTVAAGLFTTGLVHGRTAEGFRRFTTLNTRLMFAVLAIQSLCLIPAVSHLLFGVFLGLEPPLEQLTARLFTLSMPAQMFFFLRTPHQVVLYNAHATFKANTATVGRVVCTLLCSPVFIHFGWVGPYWALVAYTLPVALETAVSKIMAAPYIRRLPRDTLNLPTVREMFAFCMPLSLGGFFLSMSSFCIAAFIARADAPTRMLGIHYIAMGLINPVSFAAMRLQAVVLAFPPINLKNTRTLRFALGAGALLALIPQLVQIPPLYNLYLGGAQNLPPSDIPLARLAILAMSIFPLCQAFRGHAEGVAAWARQPNAILAGQAVFLSTLVMVLLLCLSLRVPGYLMGVCGLIAASLATTGTVRMAVQERFRQPLGPTVEAEPSETNPV
ncbi:MAG: hypothetical protein R6X19_04175 [Kiritimatiellia bacterium]